MPPPARKNPNRKLRPKFAPETDEDHNYVAEHEERKAQLDQQRAVLEQELAECMQEKNEVTEEWEKLQMQPSELARVERKRAELEFGIRAKYQGIRSAP